MRIQGGGGTERLELTAVRYEGGGPFHEELKRRVDAYFEQSGRSRRGSARLYLKTAILLAWFGGSYALLVFAAHTWWQALAAALSLGLAMAGIGFSIQHDANHGGYSDRKGINRVLGLTLDLLGGSSFLWRHKHNVLHHTHTNIVGADPDLYAEPMMRMAPDQPLRRAHRFQHLYVWLLYAFLTVKWQFFDDFETLVRGTLAGQKIPRPSRRELAGILAGKAVFFGWAVLLPALLHPFWQVAVFHLVASFTLGVTLAVCFQLAHCVGEAEFPHAERPVFQMRREWAAHQVLTTVNFSRGNRLLTWYLGGLNHQIEHHLFPKISHVHYPALSRIVEAACGRFGLPYRSHRSVGAAVASHYRWLWRMGRAAETGAAPDELVPGIIPGGEPVPAAATV